MSRIRKECDSATRRVHALAGCRTCFATVIAKKEVGRGEVDEWIRGYPIPGHGESLSMRKLPKKERGVARIQAMQPVVLRQRRKQRCCGDTPRS